MRCQHTTNIPGKLLLYLVAALQRAAESNTKYPTTYRYSVKKNYVVLIVEAGWSKQRADALFSRMDEIAAIATIVS